MARRGWKGSKWCKTLQEPDIKWREGNGAAEKTASSCHRACQAFSPDLRLSHFSNFAGPAEASPDKFVISSPLSLASPRSHGAVRTYPPVCSFTKILRPSSHCQFRSCWVAIRIGPRLIRSLHEFDVIQGPGLFSAHRCNVRPARDLPLFSILFVLLPRRGLFLGKGRSRGSGLANATRCDATRLSDYNYLLGSRPCEPAGLGWSVVITRASRRRILPATFVARCRDEF